MERRQSAEHCASENSLKHKYNLSYHEMKTYLKTARIQEFPKEWEENICKLVSKQRDNQPIHVFEELMQEVKESYEKDMEKVVETIVFAQTFSKNFFAEIEARNTDKSQLQIPNKIQFQRRQTSLMKKYFLYMDAIEVILLSAEDKLPSALCDFRRYHQMGILNLDEFEEITSSDIKTGSLGITNKFYVETSNAIMNSRVLKKMRSKRFSNAMRCVTNIFVQQIINVMIRSIDHIIKMMEEGQYCPQIRTKLLFENREFHLSPSLEEIASTYHNLIESISNIAQDLIPLDEWLNVRTNQKYIKIKLPEWYVKEAHDKLKATLKRLYLPLEEHLNKVSADFQPICEATTKVRILSASSSTGAFDSCLKRMHVYKVFFAKSTQIAMNEYYNIGLLEQVEVKASLRNRSSDIINMFIKQGVKYHQEFNKSICTDFEELSSRALDVPRDAKQLIELGEYVSYASNTFLKELELKIRQSIRMLIVLLDVTTLTDEHINLNRETINWLSNIKPVFAQSNTLTEAMKSDLEEDMQRRINSLGTAVDEVVPQLSVLDEMDDMSRIQEYVEYYGNLLKQMNRVDSEMQAINEEERMFRFPETEFPKAMELKEIIMPFYSLIHTIHQWQRDHTVWLDGPFEWLDARTIETKTMKYFEEITEANKTFRARIKMDVTTSKCFKFSGIADDPDPMQQPVPLKLCWQTLQDINEFIIYLPLVTCMCNPALQKRHWDEMSAMCNSDLRPNAGTTLRKIIAFDLMRDIEKYEAISISANRELSLQRKLSEMRKEWNTVSFKVVLEKEADKMVFENLEDIETLLADHATKIQEMQASNFVKPIESEVSKFSCSISRVQEILEYWDYVQERKLSLKSIFSYPGIENVLGEEKSLYVEVESALSKVHQRVLKAPNFRKFDDPKSVEDLQRASENLEMVNKGVKNYMQEKRIRYARFFFLSDKEVQDVLFDTANSDKPQLLVKKCFPGVHSLRINRKNEIRLIFGMHREELKLTRVVKIQEEVGLEEKWLLELENEMIEAVRTMIFQCCDLINNQSEFQIILDCPSMAIVCAQRIQWTSDVHTCLEQPNHTLMNNLKIDYIERINLLVNELKVASSRRNRSTLSSLIMLMSHQTEIIKQILDRNISNSEDFNWISQLRYFVNETSINVSTFNATVKYGFEYDYYNQSIVSTPLTDRCFHTLMQAHKYHFYSSIIGSSNSGKTETVKSLAKAIAVQFRSFNCNETISHAFLSQLLNGSSSCGAWLCLENFDKLKVQVLSSIAQQFVEIRQALLMNLQTICTEQTLLDLNSNGHICIVTNFNSSVHSVLPDNLKMLFRTMAMIVPDIQKIAEIELFATGFLESKELAIKIATIYKTQLFCETCGNFNLRSLKALVKSASYLKQSVPNENESMLILRSFIDTSIPRLCHADIVKLREILHEVFPIDLLPFNHDDILIAIKGVCKEKSIIIHDVLKLKMIQTFEILSSRKGCIIIGEPLVGKTSIISILSDALTSLHNSKQSSSSKVSVETIIPGVLTYQELFGYFDKRTGIWKDGICPKILRSAIGTDGARTWIVFDGPLNHTWMETLYSVLDADQALYLSSGETINTSDSRSIIFETMDTIQASPASLSRSGIIYIESNSIDWRPFVKAHIANNKLCSTHSEILHSLFDWIMQPCLQFVRESCESICTVSELHMVKNTLRLLNMYLEEACAEITDEKGKIGHFLIWVQAVLLLAIAWGFGGALHLDSNVKFNAFCMKLWTGDNSEFPRPEAIKHFEIALPPDGLIQDYFYVFKGVGNWKSWNDLLKGEKVKEVDEFKRAFAPTANSLKYTNLFLKHVKHRKPFIIFNSATCGLTTCAQQFFKTKLPEGNMCNLFSFASLDSIEITKRFLLSKFDKLKRGHYGLPERLFCTNFIDDLNLINSEIPVQVKNVLELLRQYNNYGYVYQTGESQQIHIRNTMFCLGAKAQNGRIDICRRFLRHFNCYNMYPVNNEVLSRIFSSVLFSNLKANHFAADVLTSVTSITNATVRVYNSVIKTLLPNPSKFQYFFDMRDIARVIGGCCLLQKESVETKLTFARLWVHETWRVFGDRILNKNDKDLLFQTIKEAVKANFKDSFETAFDYLPKYENQITVDSFDDLAFVNLVDTERNKKYEEVNSMESLKNKLELYIEEYNNKFKKKLNLALTRHALDYLIKIARILATPGGNLIIIASAASGRRSMAKLASFTQQQAFFEPPVHAYCNQRVWKDCLKSLLRGCGAERKDTAFFLPDKQLDDSILRDVSGLLATGEVPDLFSTEDKRNIVEMVRLQAQGGNRNAEISIRAVMDYFAEQCKYKSHLLLCLSPMKAFHKSCLSLHPVLLKHCTISSYETWPTSAFQQIGVKYMKNVKIGENLKPLAVKVAVQFHNSIRETCGKYYLNTGRLTHVTPSAYLHMLKLYSKLVSKKQAEIIISRNRYLAGLEKLELAAEQVAQMKATLTILKPQLEQSAQQTLITMMEVEQENSSVEKATILVKEEEEIANKKTEIAAILRTECEADLAVAIPILEDAVAALNTLKPTDITLVKAMKNPPDTVKLVMAAVCVMLNVPSDKTIDPVTGKKYIDYWGPSKRILGDMNFLQNLKEYDKDNIPTAVMQTVKKTYMTDNSFMPHIVAKASSAAEGLCKWVRAIVSYDEVAKVVAPKKEKLNGAQRECDEAEAFLNEKRSTLAALNAKLAALNSSLQETLQRKLKLEREVENCTAKLKTAENLIASLGGEKSRWMLCAEDLQRNYDNLIGDVLLSSAIIAYLAPYGISYREETLNHWKAQIDELGIRSSRDFNFTDILGSESELNNWFACGLPKNRFSTENAVIINHSDMSCLLIDSQNQANQWIKTIEKRNDLEVVKLTDPDFMSTVLKSIEFGKPILIENVGESLDVLLDPILLKEIYSENGICYLDTGKDVIQYSVNCRLYITTRLMNPRYSYAVFSKVTVIDFSIPEEALQVRLLDVVISKEKPELQDTFEQLLMQDAANKIILKQQEENILITLSSSTSNILEDENAIRILDASKNLSLEVSKKQEALKLMTNEINEFRESYIQFVKYCAGLFGTLNALCKLNHMYRFSFSWFIQLYIRSIDMSNRSSITAKRLEFLKTSFTQNLHQSVCRSLCEKHKILYSFLLCCKILLNAGKASEEEIKLFLLFDFKVDEETNSITSWLSPDVLKKVSALSKSVEIFESLTNEFSSDNNTWKKYYNSKSVENEPMPEPWQSKLTEFQKLILLKTLRPDKIFEEILRTIRNTMGTVPSVPPQDKISESYAESTCLTPLIFILPSSVCPLSLITAFASKKGYSSKLITISMGEGQEQKAEMLIEKVRSEGGWVFLQNCHLVPHWMARLEKICEINNSTNIALDSRLWLSSCAFDAFPISTLQSSIKITYDYPLDFNQQLLNLFQSEPIATKEFFEGCPGKDKVFSRLLFGLCFFHIAATLRNYFGPQGWSIPYDFNCTDLNISMIQLQDIINNSKCVPFDSLLYLIGDCNYAGKMVDERDRSRLRSLLECYCNANTIADRQSNSCEIESLIPKRCEYIHIIKHIEKMPANLPAEVFGTSEDCMIIRETAIATEFRSMILDMNQIDLALDD